MESVGRETFAQTCKDAGIPEKEAWEILVKLYDSGGIKLDDIEVTGVGRAGLSGAVVVFVEYGHDRYTPDQDVLKIGPAEEIWRENENYQKLNQRSMRAAFIPIKGVFPLPKTPDARYAALCYADARTFLGAKRLQSLQEFLSKQERTDDILGNFSDILAGITRVIHNLEPRIGQGTYGEIYERYFPEYGAWRERLREAVSGLESQFAVEGSSNQDPLTASTFLEQFSNPLLHLPEMLNARANRVHLRMIHGDLNLQNVMVNEDGTEFALIDWATLGPDQPVVFDFAKLYVELCNHLLDPLLDGPAARDFEVALYDDLLAESRDPAAVGYRSLVDKNQEWVRRLCLEVIRKATMVYDDVGYYDTFRKEWLRAVCFYALRTTCFKNFAERKEIRSRAFLKAAICCSALQDGWEVPRIEESGICEPAVSQGMIADGAPLLTRVHSQQCYDRMRQQTNLYFDIAEEILCSTTLERDHAAWALEGQEESAAQEPAKRKPLSLLQAVESFWRGRERPSWHCLLLGEGGQGKTTSLLALWRDLLADRRQATPVPVFLSLERYNQVREERRRDFIWHQIFSDYLRRFPEEKDIIRLQNQLVEPLRLGEMVLPKVVLMLDGFNEVTTNRDDLLQCLRDAQMMEGVQLVVASRYDIRDSYAHWDDFVALKLQPLSDEQVRLFMERKDQSCPEGLLGDLLRNPMMLVLYCGMRQVAPWAEAVKEYGFFTEPRTKTEIIHDFIVSQLVHTDQVALKAESAINRLYFSHLLPRIAYEMVRRGHSRLAYRDLVEIVSQELEWYSSEEFLAQHPEITIRLQSGLDRKRLREMHAMDAVYALCKQICFLTEVRVGREPSYEFRHEEFRNYFAAIVLREEIERNDRQLERFLIECTQSYRWDDVLLYASLMLDKGDLLRVLAILGRVDAEIGAQMAGNSRYPIDRKTLRALARGLGQKLEKTTPFRALQIAHLLGDLRLEDSCALLVRFAYHSRGSSQLTTTVSALRKIGIPEWETELPWLARTTGLDESTLSTEYMADTPCASWVKPFLEGSCADDHAQPTQGNLIDDLIGSNLLGIAVREDEIGIAAALAITRLASRAKLLSIAKSGKTPIDVMAAVACAVRFGDDIASLVVGLTEETVYKEIIEYGDYEYPVDPREEDYGNWPSHVQTIHRIADGTRLNPDRLFKRVAVITAHLLGYSVSTSGLDLLFSEVSSGTSVAKPDRGLIFGRLMDLIVEYDPMQLRQGTEATVNRIIDYKPFRPHPFYGEARIREMVERKRINDIEAYEDRVCAAATSCLVMFGQDGWERIRQMASEPYGRLCRAKVEATKQALEEALSIAELCEESTGASLFLALQLKTPSRSVVRNAAMLAEEETRAAILVELLKKGIIDSRDAAIASFGLKRAGRELLGHAIGMMSPRDYSQFLELVKQFDKEAAMFLLNVATSNQGFDEHFCRLLFDVYHVGSWSSVASLLLLAKSDSIRVPTRGLGEEWTEQTISFEGLSLVERLRGAPTWDSFLVQADIVGVRQEARDMTEEDLFLLWLVKEYATSPRKCLLAESILEEALRSTGGNKQYVPPSDRPEMLEVLVRRFEETNWRVLDWDIPRCILRDCVTLGESAFHIPEQIIRRRIGAYKEFEFCPWMSEAIRSIGKFGDRAVGLIQELVDSRWFLSGDKGICVISAVGDVKPASSERLLLRMLDALIRSIWPRDFSLDKRWIEFLNSCRKIGLPSIRVVLLLDLLYRSAYWKGSKWAWRDFPDAVHDLAKELRSQLPWWQRALTVFSLLRAILFQPDEQIRKVWEKAIEGKGPAAHPSDWGLEMPPPDLDL